MAIEQRDLSLKFYSFLCDIIGTDEVVNKRRDILSVKEDRSREGGFITVSSGSKAEGLDLNASDYDEIIVLNFIEVFERLDHASYSHDIDGTLSLIMDTENVKPGFTKLWSPDPPDDGIVADCMDRRTGLSYLSSTDFRQMMFDRIGENYSGYYLHGPCSSDGLIDLAFSLYCTEWISQALPWITRTKYSWASDEVIRNILCSGVLFVSIGSKNSPNSDLEWRISFSYAAKKLIFCFNHVQFLCYALLKILLKDIIKKQFGDLLCSYFMKTIMFWLCEETDVAFWRKENMLLCFMTCFRRLIYCVKNETCLHYFIPENNLFQNRFNIQHKELLAKLHGLLDLGWTCLLQTETLQSFNGYLKPSLSSKFSLSTFFPCLQYLRNTWSQIYINAESFERCMYDCIRSKKKRDLFVYLLSSLCQFSAQKRCEEVFVPANNKLIYRKSRHKLSNLLAGVNYDAVSGWLLLATFFFKNKQYDITRILIDYSLSKFTPEKCELNRENRLWQLQHYIKLQNIIGLRCLKNYTISSVIITKHSSIMLDEMKSMVKIDDHVSCPSIIYAHMLNVFFYCHIGDDREKERALCNFKFLTEKYKPHKQSRERYVTEQSCTRECKPDC